MSRAAILKTTVITAVLLVGATTVGYRIHTNRNRLATVTNAQHQLTQVSYHGQQGSTALQILEDRTHVQTKHYSFGDMVVSINGVSGNGPKYWTFYINGKQASVGAGSYQTKPADLILWKLQ
jgi:YD repeat-containing protein